MPGAGNYTADSLRSDLLIGIQNLDTHIKNNEQQIKQRQTLSVELQRVTNTLEMVRGTANFLSEIFKEVKGYINEKKEQNMRNLNEAVYTAGRVVPDADMRGVSIVIKDEKARILNGDGQDVNSREGSAFRAAMALFIKHTLLDAQPQALKCFFFDEAFSTMSDLTSATVRDFLELFAEDSVIVGIEQHPIIFEGIASKQFEVRKNEAGVSNVRRVL